MAKKLLNEATVRRFQKLANVAPINEMYNKHDDKMEETYDEKKDHMMQEQEEEMDVEMGAEDAPADMGAEAEEMGADEEEMDADEEEMEDDADMDVEITNKHAEAIIDLADMFKAALGDMDMDAEEGDEDAEEAEEAEEMEMVAETESTLSEEEIVNEVAKRVALRLAEAKKAEKKMNEALGRKK